MHHAAGPEHPGAERRCLPLLVISCWASLSSSRTSTDICSVIILTSFPGRVLLVTDSWVALERSMQTASSSGIIGSPSGPVRYPGAAGLTRVRKEMSPRTQRHSHISGHFTDQRTCTSAREGVIIDT